MVCYCIDVELKDQYYCYAFIQLISIATGWSAVLNNDFVSVEKVSVEKTFHDFLEVEVLPATGIDPALFWEGFSKLIEKFGPVNKKVLAKRDYLQAQINDWHKRQKSKEIDLNDYKKFLYKIGYLVEEKEDFKIQTTGVDPEIGMVSGPQLVVPVTNARYAINAVNARWNSLYDAVYGSDVLGDAPPPGSFSPERGERVISFSKSHLDLLAPLENGLWAKISEISIQENELALFEKDKHIKLKDPGQFVGHLKENDGYSFEIILIKNGLHCRIEINPNGSVGANDIANINDIQIESAITTIIDFEDSVATVDAEDKIMAYRNWLGLMKGDLSTNFVKDGKHVERYLNSDLEITNRQGVKTFLKGRSLLLARNVGHLMTTPFVLDQRGEEVGEGLVDAICTVLIAKHNIELKSGPKNSIHDSIYIVKPKMHGPEEVKLANDVFSEVEQILQLPRNTIKIGIMDEERRTSVNLKECIREAKSRLAFINTGFLDRTGDEIHTSMEAGPMVTKKDMKVTRWINAYENNNVDVGIACGLPGKAQIGKGMWAMPDLMADLLEQKIGHPRAGANCAWVPSPTAATIHALHYHLVDVAKVQETLGTKIPRTSLSDLLDIPLLKNKILSESEIDEEIRNNAQGILGYVVRWVDMGIGCSKVPDLNNVGLMEDRATCRISSQALANWIYHGVISEQRVLEILKEMAALVDKQNESDAQYKPMATSYNNNAFEAANDLIFQARQQPSGYTEPILHSRRTQQKLLAG